MQQKVPDPTMLYTIPDPAPSPSSVEKVPHQRKRAEQNLTENIFQLSEI
jgi:hypothetical protein